MPPIKAPLASPSPLRAEGQILARLLRRPILWALLVGAGLAAVAAFQVRQSTTIAVGRPGDAGYVRNFHDPRTDPEGRPFRWSDAYGYIDVPGTGGGVPFTVTLTLNPGPAPIPLLVIVNGVPLAEPTLHTGWQTVTVPVRTDQPAALAARDLVIELRTPGQRTADAPQETHGVMVGPVAVGPPGPGIVQPSLSVLGGLVAVILGIYLLLGRVFAPLPGRQSLGQIGFVGPPLGAMLVAAGGVVAVAAVRVPVVVAAQEGAGLVLGIGLATYGLLVGSEWIARQISPAAPGAARAVAVLIAAAFVVRLGPMALPETVIIDLTWHLKWLRELLAGHWEQLYFPGDLSRVPREWGLSVLIPKSPLFYFMAAPLALLPWNLELSIKALACLLEVGQILFCYALLARFAPRLGGPWAGVLAGAMYALTPLGYRALAYGILPTIFAQWLSTASLVVLLVWAERRARAGRAGRRSLLLFAGLLALALLAFPTIAVFNTLVVGLLALAWVRRPATRSLGRTVGGVLAGAWAVAVLVYYGQYVPIILSTTLPALLGSTPAAAQSSSEPAPGMVHWRGPLDLLGWTFGFITSALPLLTGLGGLAILWTAAPMLTRRDRGVPAEHWLALLTAAWISILGIFLVANYRVDMIGKHLLYTMVPVALGSGLFLWQLAHRGGAARLWIGLILTGTAWTALTFWAQRLVQASAP